MGPLWKHHYCEDPLFIDNSYFHHTDLIDEVIRNKTYTWQFLVQAYKQLAQLFRDAFVHGVRHEFQPAWVEAYL